MTENAAERLDAVDHEACGWVARFAAGGAGPADLDAFRQWAACSEAHRAAFQRARLLWQAAGPAGLALASGIASRRVVPPARASLGRRAVLGGALAAAAGVAAVVVESPLGLWPSWSELDADYRTGPGVQRRIDIVDRVSIALNTRTSIDVRPPGGRGEGIDLLAGEAGVAVAAGAQEDFSVTAGGGRTTSRGGSRFNVRLEERSACVTCVEGVVEVDRQGMAVVLPAGQQVRYSDRGIDAAVAINPAVVTAWQDGVVIFQSTPVAEVIAEVNRYRPGRVILTNPALGRQLFNARLRIENVDRVPGQIAALFGARETVLSWGITLLG